MKKQARCRAKTRRGTKCKRASMSDSHYCYDHRNMREALAAARKPNPSKVISLPALRMELKQDESTAEKVLRFALGVMSGDVTATKITSSGAVVEASADMKERLQAAKLALEADEKCPKRDGVDELTEEERRDRIRRMLSN